MPRHRCMVLHAMLSTSVPMQCRSEAFYSGKMLCRSLQLQSVSGLRIGLRIEVQLAFGNCSFTIADDRRWLVRMVTRKCKYCCDAGLARRLISDACSLDAL